MPSSLGRMFVTVLVKILALPPNYLTLSVYRSPGLRLFPNNVQIPTMNFPPIHSYFSVPAVHPAFSSLFSSFHSSVQQPTSSSPQPQHNSAHMRSSVDVSMNSTCGIVCYHILSILGNLFCDPTVMDDLLMRQNCVNQLLEILPLTQASEAGLFIVHRQLVRALSKLVCSACESVITMGNLQQKV